MCKKIKNALLLTVLLFTSCVKVKSVVDTSLLTHRYQNIMVVIPYEKNAGKQYANILKQRLGQNFVKDHKKVEILLLERDNDALQLNTVHPIEAAVNAALATGSRDLLLMFVPTELSYHNGALQSATYTVTAVDVASQKEVWKAKLSSTSSFGPSMFGVQAADKVYSKMRKDGLL